MHGAAPVHVFFDRRKCVNLLASLHNKFTCVDRTGDVEWPSPMARWGLSGFAPGYSADIRGIRPNSYIWGIRARGYRQISGAYDPGSLRATLRP